MLKAIIKMCKAASLNNDTNSWKWLSPLFRCMLLPSLIS